MIIEIGEKCAFLFVIVLMLFIIGFSFYFMDKYQCKETARITEKDYRYSLVAGCYFKEDDGKWVKYNRSNSKVEVIYLEPNNAKQ